MSLVTHKNQKGFSLLELIIVVAIIGILIAIALPQYQNYQVRARIGDALNLVGSAKTAVGVYYSEENDWPFNNAEAGLPDAESISSVHVREIKIQSTTPLCGIIRIRLRDISKLGAMKNESIFLTPTAPSDSERTIQWTCGIENLDSRQHLVPKACRNVRSTTCSGGSDGGDGGSDSGGGSDDDGSSDDETPSTDKMAWTKGSGENACWDKEFAKGDGDGNGWVVGNAAKPAWQDLINSNYAVPDTVGKAWGELGEDVSLYGCASP